VGKGAPQAQQIADKFHLLLNLREKLKELMARKQKLLPYVETATSDTIPAPRAAEVAKSFRHMSPTRPSWLCGGPPAKLDEKQRQHVEQIRAAHRDLDTAYQLSQAFVTMLAEHRAQDLEDWLIQAKQGGIRELKSFAQGIRRDYAAVKAAFTSPWSNGQTEAQVN
jgi:transposase